MPYGYDERPSPQGPDDTVTAYHITARDAQEVSKHAYVLKTVEEYYVMDLDSAKQQFYKTCEDRGYEDCDDWGYAKNDKDERKWVRKEFSGELSKRLASWDGVGIHRETEDIEEGEKSVTIERKAFTAKLVWDDNN